MTQRATSRKSAAPMLLAIAAIAALLAVTFWIRQRDGTSSHAASEITLPPASDASQEGPKSQRPVGQTAPSEGESAAEVAARVKKSMEQRNALKQQQIERTAAAKQKAIEAFRNERVDPSWSPQKENELGKIAESEAIAQTKIAPQNLSVDCKTTTCRLNASFASNGDAEDWTLMYMSSVGNTLPNAIVSRTQNPDGTTTIEIYGKGR